MTVENKNEPGDPFAQLMSDLEVIAKAQPPVIAPEDGDDDEKIKAAAAAAAAEGGEQGASAPMAKSLQVTLADGTVVEATDGTELVKSLIARLDGTESVMAKALTGAVELIKSQTESLKATNALVKSLEAKVGELSGQGRGRKTVLTVQEKPSGTLAKSEQPGLTAVEFMAKADAAYKAGKINGTELNMLDVSMREQKMPDAQIAQRVLA